MFIKTRQEPIHEPPTPDAHNTHPKRRGPLKALIQLTYPQ